jgi:hypothetical protein
MKEDNSFSKFGLLQPGRYHFDVPPLKGRRSTFQRSLGIMVNKNAGIGFYSTMFWLFLKGSSGVVQFSLLWPYEKIGDQLEMHMPFPVDIGFHSPRPLYEGQAPDDEECSAIGGICYYKSSDLLAQRAFDMFLEYGERALWLFMENEYEKAFGEGEEQPK